MPGPSARLLRLLALLQARRCWTGAELAARLAVTERTVRRDVDRLRALGYPIDSSVGVAGGYQLGAGATLPPLLLAEDEALAVVLGLRTAAAGTVTGIEEAAVRALAKLERVLPQRLRARVRAMHSAVAPLYFADPQVDATTLTGLAAACRDHERSSFRYGDRKGSTRERLVEPHGLVHTGARWYLVAWDVDRGDWRTFRVDRIQDEPRSGERFTPRAVPGGDTAAYVERSIAARGDTMHVCVTFHAPAERVAQQAPSLAGHLRRVGDNRCEFESDGHSLAALALHVAAIGEEFEVAQPPELAERVEALAARLRRGVVRSARST